MTDSGTGGSSRVIEVADVVPLPAAGGGGRG